jgi:F0F1-type ATP synthase gamma subunit
MSRITINDAISYFDAQCPNQYSQEEKIKWLSELDEQIYNDVIALREGADNIEFNGYDNDSLNTELLVETPYTEIYRYWLEKSVDFSNREITAMNNAIAMYNNYLDDYTSWYNRQHKKSAKQRWFI